MDLQPSGNNKELIFIETDEIYFIIKGKYFIIVNSSDYLLSLR